MAIENFTYQVAQYIAKYAVSMGGVDVITFTAGIGEKGRLPRRKICEYFTIPVNMTNNFTTLSYLFNIFNSNFIIF